MARKQKSEPAENTITLKLRENYFVHGQFAKAGSTFTFSREEAQKKLSTSELWDVA